MSREPLCTSTHCQLCGEPAALHAHAQGFLLEVNQLWWFVEEDNARDQQAYQAAVAAASNSHTCRRHGSFGFLILLCLPYNVSTGLYCGSWAWRPYCGQLRQAAKLWSGGNGPPGVDFL